MKPLISSAIFFICFSLTFISIYSKGYQDLKMTYQQFKTKFHKVQLTTSQQSQRQLNFYSNLQILKQKLDQGCQFCAVTKFFDQNHQQFKARMGLLPQQNSIQNQKSPQVVQNSLISSNSNQYDNLIKVAEYPNSKNWADQGKITSIKNQGGCGTCWSFATVAAVQSSLILKGEATKVFFYQPDLSEQFLLTCAVHGTCNGGYLEQAIDLAFQRGIPYQSDVPYQGQKGDQSMCSNTKRNVKYSDGDRARNSLYNVGDSQIINLLQTGPVMVALSADNWEFYGGGIFQCKSNAQVNHAVLLVGYDQQKWIIKNQWGEDWGEDGYIYITRNPLYNCRIGSAVHQLSQKLVFFSLLLFSIMLVVVL